MKILSVFIVAVILVIVSAGCKVRRISDGKPPKDGVVLRETIDQKYGPIHAEDHYRDSRLRYVKGTYSSGTLAYERFLNREVGRLDSTAWYFPSGQLMFTMVLGYDRMLFFTEYYENGTVRVHSDTTKSNEFYLSGKKNCTIVYQNGFIVLIERWYENGKKLELSEWKNDQRHGKRCEWDSTGRLTVNEFYAQGKLKNSSVT
ncbi:MAG: hypothetical protein M0R68_14140, partial [Bacteroidetes bacterium]|nr:hypothetical protein [Bacteroidota bacterium]